MTGPKLRLIAGRAGELTPEQGTRLQAALDAVLAGHPEAAELFRDDWRQQVASRTRSTEAWQFVQIDPTITRAVSEWITNHATRKRETRRVWEAALCAIDRRDGRILLTRQQMAEELGILPRHVSTCLAQLVRIGALDRMQIGRNACHRLNPHIATKLGREAGRQARKGAARPRLVAQDGEAVADRDGITHDPRQTDLEEAIADQMRRTGRLPWDLPK